MLRLERPPGGDVDKTVRFDASLNGPEHYRLLVDAITDYAIYMLDPTGIVSSWNPGAQRFKGYAPDEIIGQNFARFYTDEDRAIGLPQRALATADREGRFEHEGWRVRKDGTRFWAHVVIDPVRDDAGGLVGYAKVTRDLTERRRTESELRASEQQFRTLVNGVTDYAIYMLDRQGRVTNWNPGAQRIKQYRPDEIVGQHFSAFYAEEDRAAGLPQRALDIAARDGRVEAEGWRVRKDGSRFWASVVIDAIRDEFGDLIGYAKVTRDESERRAAQQTLEEAREALFQAQKLESLGQLTGGVAHDFNNLLTAVLGGLELVRKRLPFDPRITPLIDNAILGAERGASLTQRMLAFARRQDLKREAVDLAAMVEGSLGLWRSSLGPIVTLRVDFPAGLPRAETDAAQLELAVQNLAINARDAMPDGGVITIGAQVRSVADGELPTLVGGTYVVLTVADTGEGMDEATLARATEPFFTTKGIGKGTGLGLPMVHGLARQSGGALRLSSRPGEGVLAEIWLPLAHADAPKPPDSASGVEPKASVASNRPLVILAVDDDPLVLMNTVAMLEDQGHTALQAASGEAALAVLASHRVDLVITDQAMPGMTGLELAGHVRALAPDLPLILATGYAELPGGAEHGFAKLAKPFHNSDLEKIIAQTRPRMAARLDEVGRA